MILLSQVFKGRKGIKYFYFRKIEDLDEKQKIKQMYLE